MWQKTLIRLNGGKKLSSGMPMNNSFLCQALRNSFLLLFIGVTMPFLVPILVVMEILEPNLRVRIGKFPTERIGPLAAVANWYLRHRVMSKPVALELHLMVTTYPRPANNQLMRMIKRRLIIVEHPFFLKLYKAMRLCLKNSKIWVDFPVEFKGYYKESTETSPQIYFIKEEVARGIKELSRMGIEAGKPFICFHSRDKAYLDAALPRDQWSYHDYRDSDINNYLPAAEYLVSLGMSAVRVGYIVQHAIKTTNPRIIDYSTDYRTDFMDIYLLGNCKFFLGSNGGLCCIAHSFNIPVAAANWIALNRTLIGKRDIIIPKKLWSIEQKRFLTYREIVSSGIDTWARSERYVKAGIEVVENTPDEILALAKEMNARLDGSWISAKEDEQLQQHFRDLFPVSHETYGFPCRIGAEFLRQNKELFD